MAEQTDDPEDELDDEDEPRRPAEITIYRAELARQIDARLGGALSREQLASWAFDRFYQIELGVAQPEPEYEELVESMLDILMFSDEHDFELDEASLRDLLVQLGGA
jgi:hypothetical protein